MIEPGAQVLEYEVWGHLGGGGMSDVWLARHVDLAMPVIIKTLKPDLRATPAERVQRMLTEARLMARIPSPFVVRAYDVSTYRDTPFMAQEYVDGLDLNELDHLRRDSLGHGLPLWFVCEMTAQIAHALHGAHQHGVLHRDVKPSNLFGSPEVGAKLGDFGIAVAKRLSDRSHADQSGTLRFMSPEALRGESLDRRADVYALGATAFDLRYGTPPFPNPMVLVTGAPHPAFPAPSCAAEAQFQYVLSRMLAYSREHRYPNLAEPRRLLRALAKAAQRPPRPTRLAGAIHFCGARISTEAGDISRMSADGIVSSANWQLQMRTGVGEALRLAGGDVIEDEARAQGEQPLGACIVTGPGQLRCRHVLHAVSAWEQASCVGRATQRALLIAERLGLRTLVLPALGTGAAGVALEACASTMAAALRWHMELGGTRLSDVRIVLYDDERLQNFREVFEAGLLGEEEPVPDWGLPHVAARIDEESTSGEAPTVAGGLPLRRE